VIVGPSDGYVKVLGFKLYYRSFGRPEKGTVLALHGGPGCGHNGLLPLADLVQFGYRVVLYDQIGCGRSERPTNTEYYTQSRAVDEVEGVRKALRLGKVHLFGGSYGGALALDVALKYPNGLRSLVVYSGTASNSLFEREYKKLVSKMPRGVRSAIRKYEASGDLKNPKYLAAMDVFGHKHFCRLRVWPYDYWYMVEHMVDVSHGREKGWDVTDRLPEIRLPCLITLGEYDVVTPKCVRPVHRGIRGSKLVVFHGCSHSAIWEDRAHFIEVIRDFFDHVSSPPRKRPQGRKGGENVVEHLPS
jgi:proline-specific peptidase